MKKVKIRQLKSQIKSNSTKATLTVTNAKHKSKEFKIICFVKYANLLLSTVLACRSITICMEISDLTVSNAGFYQILTLIRLNNLNLKTLILVSRALQITMMEILSINARIVKLKIRSFQKLKNKQLKIETLSLFMITNRSLK